MIKYTVTIQSICFLIIPKIQSGIRTTSCLMTGAANIYEDISNTRSDEIEQKQKNTRRIFHYR